MEVEPRNSLSNLPDVILHHILSFLEVADIARLRVLSRSFLTLCTTAPSFSFTPPPDHRNCLCPHVFNFMNALPRHRPHALKINKLSFESFCQNGEHRRRNDEWINKLFQTFHVEQLSLYCHMPIIFRSLPRFQSLKVLKLKMRFSLVLIKLPVMKLASLETLYVIYMRTEDSVGDWVSQSFPSLKCLFLNHINVAKLPKTQLDLTIRRSCLVDLSIHDCCSFKPVRVITENLRTFSYNMAHRDDEVVVEISAPNLQSFSWKGAPTRLCYDARTFKSLHVANITQLKFKNWNLAMQLFEAIGLARLLHIDTNMLKDLYGKPSISFGNVCHFEILVERYFNGYKSWPKEEDCDNVGDVLINFLKRILNLGTLTFVSEPLHNPKAVPAAEEYVLKGAVRMCGKTKWKEIKELKKVKFKIRSMYYSMAVVIGMLKTRGVDLEEMTLVYPSRYHESITLYLNCLESASSALSINLISF